MSKLIAISDDKVISKIYQIRGKKVMKINKITIRLQGVDAPELHYETEPLTDQDREPAIKHNWNYSWFRKW